MITAYNLHDSDGKLAIPLPRTNYYKNRSAMRTWGLMLSLLHSALIEFGIAVSLLSCVIKNLP